MRQPLFSIGIFSWLAFPTIALAHVQEGVADGGGGNAVVCFTDQSIPDKIRNGTGEILDDYIAAIDRHPEKGVEAYDLFAAKVPWGKNAKTRITPQILPLESGENAEGYPEKVAKRFEKTVAGVSELIRHGYRKFQADQTKWPAHGLAKIDKDVNPVPRIPDNCILATLAHQYNRNGLYFLEFDWRLAQFQSDLSDAVIRLHEALFSEARERGHEDSLNTRELIGYLITTNRQLTIRKLTEIVEKLGFGKEESIPDLQNKGIQNQEHSFSVWHNAYPHLVLGDILAKIKDAASAEGQRVKAGIDNQVIQEANALLRPRIRMIRDCDLDNHPYYSDESCLVALEIFQKGQSTAKKKSFWGGDTDYKPSKDEIEKAKSLWTRGFYSERTATPFSQKVAIQTYQQLRTRIDQIDYWPKEVRTKIAQDFYQQIADPKGPFSYYRISGVFLWNLGLDLPIDYPITSADQTSEY